MSNHILAYYQAIVSGEVTVSRYIRLWYENIVHGIEEKRYTFDPKKASRAIRFIEGFCRHHEGALAPNLITLELWQKAFLSVVFGIVDDTGSRQFREVLLIIGRKNGKTLLAAAIAAYMAYLDGEYGARIYFCAPKLDQSRLCYEAFYQMILKEQELSDRAKKRRTDIYIAESNSSAMPLAFNARKSDGLNPHLTVCDEIASWQGDAGLKQYEVLKSALGARKQPLLLSISTAGYVNDGIYDELIKRATAVLEGSSGEKRLAPFLYMADNAEHWNDINELAKSNPNMGVSVSADYLLEEIAVAEQSLSKKAEFLTKYCNIKQNSSSAWLSSASVNRVFVGTERIEDFADTYCLAGIDLSQTTDLTAACVVIERDGIQHLFTRFFMPQEKLDEATARDGIPYATYVKSGELVLSGDNFVDYHDVFDWFRHLVEDLHIYPLRVGYDRYSSQYLIQDMEAYGFVCESVFQGTNLTGVINNTEGLLKDGKIRCSSDQRLTKLHLLDSAMKTETDTNRRKLIKVRKNAHVDGTAALLDAMCMRQNHWDELGSQLENRM